MTMGDRIKNLRLQRGLTQEELGAIVGVKKSAIYKYESGLVVNLKRDTIEKLARALGVRPTTLMGLETFDTGAEFEERWKKVTRNTNGESLTVIHTTDPRKFINYALDQMTEEGQNKVAERAAEVLEVPRYRKGVPKD